MDAVERGKELKRLRERANLIQRDVANHFGITASAVSEWERGTGSPEWPKIRPLDDLLKADGEVLRLFNLEPGATSSREELDALWAAVREMRSLVDLLAAEDPPAGQSSPPGAS